MINCLNHHTSYNYSKFTARPTLAIQFAKKYLLNKGDTKANRARKSLGTYGKLFPLIPKDSLIEQKVKARPVAKPNRERNQISQVPHSTAPFFTKHKTKGKEIGAMAAANVPTLVPQKFKNVPLRTGDIGVNNGIYQAKELLCWRFDRVFLNLQSSFLGVFKALRICRAFARNNKRIVFVSSADNRLQEGMGLAINELLQFFPRDDLPRLRSRALAHPLNSVAKPINNVKVTRRKNPKPQHHSVLRALSHLVKANNKNDQKLNEKAHSDSPVHHKLNGLVAKAAARRLTASYSEVPPAFFSNTQKPFFEKFNHLAYLNSHQDSAVVGYALKQAILDTHTHGLPNCQNLVSRQQSLRPRRKKNRYVFNENMGTKGIFHYAKASRQKRTKDSTAGAKDDDGRKKIGHIKKSTSFKRWWISDNYYKLRVRSQIGHRMKQRASNAHLNQADLIFFTDPDRNPGLANQIKKLGIPSIGIVSGLKTPAHYKIPSHSNLHDSVTYPIIGNPNSTNFVFLILRMFGLLIRSTYGKVKGRPRDPQKPAEKAIELLLKKWSTSDQKSAYIQQQPGPLSGKVSVEVATEQVKGLARNTKQNPMLPTHTVARPEFVRESKKKTLNILKNNEDPGLQKNPSLVRSGPRGFEKSERSKLSLKKHTKFFKGPPSEPQSSQKRFSKNPETTTGLPIYHWSNKKGTFNRPTQINGSTRPEKYTQTGTSGQKNIVKKNKTVQKVTNPWLPPKDIPRKWAPMEQRPTKSRKQTKGTEPITSKSQIPSAPNLNKDNKNR